MLRYFKACDATNDTIISLTDCPENSDQKNEGTTCFSAMTTTSYETTDVINCSYVFDEVKKDYFSKDTNYLKQEISKILTYYKDLYLSKVESVYKNMSEILEAVPQHVNCINSIHLLENMAGDLLLLVNTSKVTNIGEAIPILNKLLDSYLLWKKINEDFKIVGKEIYEVSCFTWLQKIVKIEEPLIKSTFDNLQKGGLDDYRKESYELFMKTISLDYHSSGTAISQCMNQISAYLERNITKRQLTTSFSGITMTKALHDITDAVAVKTQYLIEFKRKVDSLNLKVTEGLGNLTNLTLPILNRINAQELSFIKAAQHLDRMEFNKMIKSFDDDFHGNFKLLKMNYNGFGKATEQMLKNISSATNHLEEHVTRLQDDLAKYKKSTDMDVDFYK